MEKVELFSFEKHEGPYENWPPLSRLYFNNRLTSVSLGGYAILAQLKFEHGYIIVTDYDCPFEEMTTFYYLGNDLEIIDSRQFGAPYESFLLDKIEPIGPATLRFNFYGSKQFELTVLNKPEFFSRSFFEVKVT
ncbi:MAG: hypothetical protein HQM10_22785 [Candidatus Riflebacteria bacterium]|nr:hypothetical protein [Candidatus Riflebacteria bacterium]